MFLLCPRVFYEDYKSKIQQKCQGCAEWEWSDLKWSGITLE